MSQANAAARKRRAGGSSMPGSLDSVPQTPQPSAGTGLTLPQVIAVVDRRLVALETFAKETRAKALLTPAPSQAPTVAQVVAPTVAPTLAEEFLEEVNTKFELLANEIAELKDMLLKLQSYTMEVNKRLVDERIQLLSDVKESETMTFDSSIPSNIVFDLSDDNE